MTWLSGAKFRGVLISTLETVGEAAEIFLGSVTHLMPKKEIK